MYIYICTSIYTPDTFKWQYEAGTSRTKGLRGFSLSRIGRGTTAVTTTYRAWLYLCMVRPIKLSLYWPPTLSRAILRVDR